MYGFICGFERRHFTPMRFNDKICAKTQIAHRPLSLVETICIARAAFMYVHPSEDIFVVVVFEHIGNL